ncbi:hypothetical protein SeMB42_g06988 [Synchytrium endobioticum]|uniref:Uncharacterized protein n=1 Tax=Synchytrium endobioticum TaxID=286115 RepID=A0A507CBM4_9FUNG|nr:hypothetical protein SeMB42_g06988 [Synchytrium endobioticum]
MARTCKHLSRGPPPSLLYIKYKAGKSVIPACGEDTPMRIARWHTNELLVPGHCRPGCWLAILSVVFVDVNGAFNQNSTASTSARSTPSAGASTIPTQAPPLSTVITLPKHSANGKVKQFAPVENDDTKPPLANPLVLSSPAPKPSLALAKPSPAQSLSPLPAPQISTNAPLNTIAIANPPLQTSLSPESNEAMPLIDPPTTTSLPYTMFAAAATATTTTFSLGNADKAPIIDQIPTSPDNGIPESIHVVIFGALGALVVAIAALSLFVWRRTHKSLNPINLNAIDLKAELKPPKRDKSRFDKFRLRSLQLGGRGKGRSLVANIRDLPRLAPLPAPVPLTMGPSANTSLGPVPPSSLEDQGDLPPDDGILRFSNMSGYSLDATPAPSAPSLARTRYNPQQTYAAYALDARQGALEPSPSPLDPMLEHPSAAAAAFDSSRVSQSGSEALSDLYKSSASSKMSQLSAYWRAHENKGTALERLTRVDRFERSSQVSSNSSLGKYDTGTVVHTNSASRHNSSNNTLSIASSAQSQARLVRTNGLVRNNVIASSSGRNKLSVYTDKTASTILSEGASDAGTEASGMSLSRYLSS